MAETKKKEILLEKRKEAAEKEAAEKETATNNKPIYVIKGLFRDTSFIIEHAKKMAKGGA